MYGICLSRYWLRSDSWELRCILLVHLVCVVCLFKNIKLHHNKAQLDAAMQLKICLRKIFLAINCWLHWKILFCWKFGFANYFLHTKLNQEYATTNRIAFTYNIEMSVIRVVSSDRLFFNGWIVCVSLSCARKWNKIYSENSEKKTRTRK